MAPIMGLLTGFAKRAFATIGAGFSLGFEFHVFHES